MLRRALTDGVVVVLTRDPGKEIGPALKGDLGRDSGLAEVVVRAVREQTIHEGFTIDDVRGCTARCRGFFPEPSCRIRLTVRGYEAFRFHDGEQADRIAIRLRCAQLDPFHVRALAILLDPPLGANGSLRDISVPTLRRLHIADPGESILEENLTGATLADVRSCLRNDFSGQLRPVKAAVDELPRDLSLIAAHAPSPDGERESALGYLFRYVDEVVFCPRIEMAGLDGRRERLVLLVPGWDTPRSVMVQLSGDADPTPVERSPFVTFERLVTVAAQREGLALGYRSGDPALSRHVATRAIPVMSWLARMLDEDASVEQTHLRSRIRSLLELIRDDDEAGGSR